MSDFKTLHKRFVKSLTKVAKKLGKPAIEVTKTQFLKTLPDEFTEWELRKAGGYEGLKKSFFSNEVDGLDIKYGGRAVKSFQNKLEKQYGTQLALKKEFLDQLQKVLRDAPLKFHPKLKNSSVSKKQSRTIVAAISDTHFGANISNGEMSGSNEYNWTIAARRMAIYCEQIMQYKAAHRKDTDLVLQLNGDIIAGQIHNQEWFVDLLTDQFAGTLNLLCQAISYLAQHFNSIRVVCTPGNHGRNVGKADRGRATTHKWDSYETMIYIALQKIFETSWGDQIQFIIPESPFATYQIQGHWCLQTHGDTVINVGNPGKALSMGSINEQVNKFNSSEVLKGNKPVHILSVGHVHVPTVQLLDNGCMAIINGCLSGVDPFAQSIGIFSNSPTQLLFESTRDHPVGDIRLIQVKTADKNSLLDKIIVPYKKMIDKSK